ncbi:MAG: endonuclease III domain-containing protein [Deltaproteobacteria bacterium]
MDPQIRTVIRLLEKETARYRLPSVSAVARDGRDPFLILVSCILSLRTRDGISVAVSERLFKKADTPRKIASLSQGELESLVHSVNFYRNKARAIREAARRIDKEFGGKVPDTEEGLLSLKGVGRKTANLVLGLGFGVPAVCVDTHVHRISNRLGWLKTRTPEETEKELQRILDRKYWIRINELLVTFGQNVCDPVRPGCGRCPISEYCPQGRKYGQSRQ